MNAEVLLFEGCDELDALAPFEVLANAAAATSRLTVKLVTLTAAGPVTCAHGVQLEPHGFLSDRPDLLIIPGGGWIAGGPSGARAEVDRGDIPKAIAARHAAGTTIASVCTGAMLVAAAGLLEDRPAVTHRGALDDLRAAGARVVAEARVVDDGDVMSAGGVTSGIDLALWIVEKELGSKAARDAENELEYVRSGKLWTASALHER